MLGMQHGHNILEHERLIRGPSSSLEQIAEPAYVPPESAAVIGEFNARSYAAPSAMEMRLEGTAAVDFFLFFDMVLGCHGRPHDPSGGATGDGKAGWRHG